MIGYIAKEKQQVETFYAEKTPRNKIAAAVQTAVEIHKRQPQGDILIFLTGQEEIDRAVRNLEESISELAVRQRRKAISSVDWCTGQLNTLREFICGRKVMQVLLSYYLFMLACRPSYKPGFSCPPHQIVVGA